MVQKEFNVAVIGYGFSAKIFHIPFILQIPALKLYGIVQRSPKPDNDASKDFPDAKTWRSPEEMLSDAAVHVVVITTFPESHFELTRKGLEAGKHVVVEKPWVDSYREAKQLMEIAQTAERKMVVFQNRRWDSDLLTVKKIIDSGTLGRIIEFESHYDRFRPAFPTKSVFQDSQTKKYCAGCIYDLGTHLIDQAVHLFGNPTHVTGYINNQRKEATVGGDSFTVLLHYADGMLATLKGAVLSVEEKQLRFWVRGETGSFRKCNEDIQEGQLLSRSSKPGQADFGVDPESNYGFLTQLDNGKPVVKQFPTVTPITYVGFYAQLAKALAGQSEVPVRPEDAASVIKIVELAKMSSDRRETLQFEL